MRTSTLVALIAIYAAVSAPSPSSAQAPTARNPNQICEPGSGHMRTTLYFGLSHPTGVVSENQWQAFLRDEVTQRFPDGLTVWEASGQWKQANGHIARERAKVLLLVHDESPAVRRALSDIVEIYKKMFHQESVLWETAPVCAAF